LQALFQTVHLSLSPHLDQFATLKALRSLELALKLLPIAALPASMEISLLLWESHLSEVQLSQCSEI
jgi:hypothetical protein